MLKWNRITKTLVGTAFVASLIFVSTNQQALAVAVSPSMVEPAKAGEVQPMWWTAAGAAAAGGAGAGAVTGAAAGAGGLSWSLPGTLAGAGAGAASGAAVGAVAGFVGYAASSLFGSAMEPSIESIPDIVFDH
ncbi:hypothetical protein [Paenibacillus solani]|uniref:Uncharacterized protein n=1 Tax=Paenibacillus solani TaxID=1705565 RepID=A0A0M1P4E1_9BACL|nr:hypothetical protein [Paenibacillus solani]KOR88904.1 hypothetical protein AM231_06815 [Paenibacillus solani]